MTVRKPLPPSDIIFHKYSTVRNHPVTKFGVAVRIIAVLAICLFGYFCYGLLCLGAEKAERAFYVGMMRITRPYERRLILNEMISTSVRFARPAVYGLATVADLSVQYQELEDRCNALRIPRYRIPPFK